MDIISPGAIFPETPLALLEMVAGVGAGGFVTVSVTGIVTGPVEAPDAVTVTVPLYVPKARLVALTLMLTSMGVVPLVTSVESHPLGVEAEATVNAVGAPEEATLKR